MELLVWSTLDHRMCMPTAHSFLQLLVPLLGGLSALSDAMRHAIAARASHLTVSRPLPFLLFAWPRPTT